MPDYDRALRYEIFEKKEYGFADETIREANVIFDLGAYKGYFSKYCTELNPKVIIHAFEPLFSPEKSLANVVWNQEAVGSFSGTTTLWQNEQKSMQSSCFTETNLNPRGKSIFVDMTSIHDYVNTHNVGHIDLMKIDIEGSEYTLLKSFSDELWSRIDSIIVEFHQITPELKLLHPIIEKKLTSIFPQFSPLPHPYSKDLGYWWGKK